MSFVDDIEGILGFCSHDADLCLFTCQRGQCCGLVFNMSRDMGIEQSLAAALWLTLAKVVRDGCTKLSALSPHHCPAILSLSTCGFRVNQMDIDWLGPGCSRAHRRSMLNIR